MLRAERTLFWLLAHPLFLWFYENIFFKEISEHLFVSFWWDDMLDARSPQWKLCSMMHEKRFLLFLFALKITAELRKKSILLTQLE